MIQLPTTQEIAEDAEYFDSASSFFSNFAGAFSAARCQILKVETRQVYQEPGNPSYDAMISGEWDKALALVNESRVSDLELYDSLNSRGVDFIRCRPLEFPLTEYMQWAIESLRFNAEHCERIFCCNLKGLEFLFENNIQHDFMVFDSRIGFIHDYNRDGLIQGGWKISDVQRLIQLQTLFIFLKSQSQPFSKFVDA